MRKTKIICTVGPAVDNENILRELIRSGMDVARFNFSHGDYKSHKERADAIKAIREEMGLPIALLCDTKGPEIRLGEIEGKKVELVPGQDFTLHVDDIVGDSTNASISFKELYRDVSQGSRILIDDGLIEICLLYTSRCV